MMWKSPYFLPWFRLGVLNILGRKEAIHDNPRMVIPGQEAAVFHPCALSCETTGKRKSEGRRRMPSEPVNTRLSRANSTELSW